MNISKKLIITFSLFVGLFFQAQALAGACLTPGTHIKIDSRNGFCFTFNIESDGTNRARIEGPYFKYFPVWTDDSTFDGYSQQIYEPSFVNDGIERQFEIKFERTSNWNSRHIVGIMTYSINGEVKKTDKRFNLSSAVGVDKWEPKIRLNLIGNQFTNSDEYCVSSGSCNNLPIPTPPMPPINTNPQFEFGTLKDGDCRDVAGRRTCTITYANSYDPSKPKPLVFLMPTIEPSISSSGRNETEYPSTASVSQSTYNNATIFQEFAPRSKALSSVTFVESPMVDIDYFVIEPGVLDLAGGKIVAGLVSTNVTASFDHENESTTVNFAPFGGEFDAPPGVLVQAQTKNNTRDWFTGMARDVEPKKFELSLDRSEVGGRKWGSKVDKELPVNESVGFVAGLGEGFIQGSRFWIGDGETLKTQDFSEKIIAPVEDGCKEFTDISFAGFDTPPVLVANKNSRDGVNGGWLRRCSITKDKVNFIVEEDMDKDKERAHIKEYVGFFMFEKPNPQPICKLFNAPAQTWNGNSSTTNQLVMSNGSIIKNAPVSANKRYLGYDINGINDTTMAGGCEGLKCLPSIGLKVERWLLEDVPAANSTHTVIASNTEYYGNVYKGHVTVEPGATLTLKSGTYWFDTLNIRGTVDIPVGENVIINVKALALSSGATFSSDISSEKPGLVVVHDDPVAAGSIIHPYVDINGIGTSFSGLLYSEREVYLSNSSTLTGAITSKKLDMANNSILDGQSFCFDPPEAIGSLVVTPIEPFSLTCQTAEVEFKVVDETGAIISTEQGEFIAAMTPDSSAKWCEDSAGASCSAMASQHRSHFINGKKTLYLSSTALQEHQVSATWGEDSVTAPSTVKFVPFKFHVDDLSVIAGKKYEVSAKVLSCNSSGSPTSEDYTGTPTIGLNIIAPVSGNDDSDLLDYAPEFVGKGETKDTLSIEESGDFRVTLTDTSYNCSGVAGCPIDGTGVLNGSFELKSRPWKVAICDVKAADDSKNNPAKTNEIGGYFISANTDFKATFKPIVHSDFYTASRDECSHKTTLNYFTETGHAAPFKVSFDLRYPSSGTLSNLASDEFAGDFSFLASDKVTTSRQKTINFSWDEVGSLLMKSDADYLSMSLDQETQVIGRFYPDHFNITQSNWTAPEKQGGSTYMDQPFKSVGFEVKAYNRAQDETKNYGNFDNELKASFYFRGATSDRVSILDAELDSNNWAESSGVWSRTWTNAKWKRLGAGTKTTTPDGPYNSTWAGDVTTKTELSLSLDSSGDGNSNYTDPTLFKIVAEDGTVSKEASQPLLSQPNVRYGRMVLQDIGGNEGAPIRIPLRVEYWRGGRFVLNSSDNISRFDTNKNMQCNSIEWSEITPAVSDAKFANTLNPPSDAGNVVAGESRSIYARQSTSRREQVRMFLRQGSANPDGVTCGWTGGAQPWLQYNWRNKGDEDPSAVVTFGINRGNDRVIFRSEPGLTSP